jgi:hypothetical protein
MYCPESPFAGKRLAMKAIYGLKGSLENTGNHSRLMKNKSLTFRSSKDVVTKESQ